eukprot:s333_g30.t1
MDVESCKSMREQTDSDVVDLTPKIVPGLDGHVDFCKRQRRSAFTMPWERGVLGHSILPTVGLWEPKGAFPLSTPQLSNATDVLQVDERKPATDSVSKLHASTILQKFSRGVTWNQHLTASRALALKKWVAILTEGGIHFEIVQQHFAMTKLSQVLLIDALEMSLTAKSTSTLHSRAGPVLRYVAWCKSVNLNPFPMDKIVTFKFLDMLKDSCAPTFPRSFIGSVAFMVYCLGLESGKQVLGASMVTGLATSVYLKKRKTLQRPPLKVWHVKKLENLANGNISTNVIDQIAAGFFCYLTYARARFSDGQNSGNFTVDIVPNSDPPWGYLEASLERSKTSFSLERKTKYLPMVAQINGLTTPSWALNWIDAIKRGGLVCGSGKPLLPAPLQAGEWDSLPISAESATKWIRKLLLTGQALDQEETEYILRLGTHSCKTTILSWAAKKGTDLQLRKIMGYHSLGRNNSVFIYGRDNISPALREVTEIVKMVADGLFFPDQTRSGYFLKDDNTSDEKVENIAPSLEELRGDSSSEDSADEDEVEHSVTEKAVGTVVGRWTGDFDPEILPKEPDRYLRHGVSRILHLVADESGSALTCGRLTTRTYEKLDEIPKVLHPVCKQCFALFYKNL